MSIVSCGVLRMVSQKGVVVCKHVGALYRCGKCNALMGAFGKAQHICFVGSDVLEMDQII